MSMQKKVALFRTDSLFVKSGKKFLKINLSEILFVESFANYVYIHMEDRGHLVLYTLQNLKKLLPSVFIQTHRSYVVNTERIRGISENRVIFANSKNVALINRTNLKGFKEEFVPLETV